MVVLLLQALTIAATTEDGKICYKLFTMVIPLLKVVGRLLPQ
jgi:hypothetical protein